MILVLGGARVQPGRIDEALAISHAHVQRSRGEPGCIAHAVHIDGEDAQRLVFVEQWADMPALLAHFRVPASREMVKALTALCAAPPAIQLYDATALPAPF